MAGTSVEERPCVVEVRVEEEVGDRWSRVAEGLR
jgi:hypothetical protein